MIFLELFGIFFLIGLFTFGGGYAMIPLIEGQVVSRGWISVDTLYDFIAVSEVTPGPFAINIATFIGSSQGSATELGAFGGFLGALCATFGVVLPSFIVIILLATILNKVSKSKYLAGAIDGVKPIVISLISSTVIMLMVKTFFFGGSSLSSPFVIDRATIALFIIGFGFTLIYKRVFKKEFNTILMLVISAIFGIIVF